MVETLAMEGPFEATSTKSGWQEIRMEAGIGGKARGKKAELGGGSDGSLRGVTGYGQDYRGYSWFN